MKKTQKMLRTATAALLCISAAGCNSSKATTNEISPDLSYWTYNAVASTEDSAVATAEYIYDAKTKQPTIKITPVSEGSTVVYISFGKDQKLRVGFEIEVSKTGAIYRNGWAEETGAPKVDAISLDETDKDAIADADFWEEWGVGNGSEVSDVPENVWVKVTANGASDYIPLNDENVEVIWSGDLVYGSENNALRIGLNGKYTNATATLKQKLRYRNNAQELGLVANNISVLPSSATDTVSAEFVTAADGTEWIEIKALKPYDGKDKVTVQLSDGFLHTDVNAVVAKDYSFGDPSTLLTKFGIDVDLRQYFGQKKVERLC